MVSLFTRGALGAQMRTEYFARINPFAFYNNYKLQRALHFANKSRPMLEQMVRRSSLTWKEFNIEDQEHYYSQPAIELDWLEKNMGKLAQQKSEAEFRDIEIAVDRLRTYRRALDIMDNAANIGIHLTLLNVRIATNNVSNPMNILRYSSYQCRENLVAELEKLTRAYYQMIDDCASNPAWVKKLEDEVGQEVAFTFLQFDETSREAMSQESEVFARFENEKMKYFR